MRTTTRLTIDSLCDGDARVEVCIIRPEFKDKVIVKENLELWDDPVLIHMGKSVLEELFGEPISEGQTFLVREQDDGTVETINFSDEVKQLSKELYSKALRDNK